MSYKDKGNLDEFTAETAYMVEQAKEKSLKSIAKYGKDAVQRHIPRTVGKRRHTHRKPLHKDIQAGLVADKIYGGKRVRIRGGKHTGTIWHILNNGTYRIPATHFLDNAIAEIDAVTDEKLDIALSEEFGRR